MADDDDLAGFIGSVATSVVAQTQSATSTTTRTTTSKSLGFRVEFNCQNGRHYAKMMKGRGSKRRKNSGEDGESNYEYLGKADVVAQRGGYYAQRWLEYSFTHTCNYA